MGTSSPGSPRLSIVIPAYNESQRIRQTLDTIARHFTERGEPVEILLVDDGSQDDTADLARAAAARDARIRVLRIVHGGKAAALRAGMRAASGEVILFTDADLATPLSYVKPFQAAIEAGADIVIGSREGAGARRIDEPPYRHVMGRVFNALVRLTVLPGIQDTQCGFKMFKRDVANDLLDRARLYPASEEPVLGPRVTAFDVELLVVARRQGYRILAIPVEWTYGSRSKVNPVRDTLNNLRDILLVKLTDLRGRYH